MFASWIRFLTRSRRPAARPNTKRLVVPSLESLEERWVPSTMDGTISTQSLLGTGFNSLDTTSAVTSGTGTNNTAAASTQQVSANFNAFQTGGSASQSVAQFDPSLGTLNSVQVLLTGQLTSDVKIENLDSAPSSVNAQVNGNLSLQGPGGSLLSVAPSINENSTSLSAYDGALDYGGASGHDFGAQSASAQQSVTLTSNLSAWQGTGQVALTETAQSSSTVSGSGNEQVNIASFGSGSVRVIYNYTPNPVSPPPAPSTPPPSPSPAPSPPPSSSCTPPSGPASINGVVYVDTGKSGQYAASDPGVNQATVTLTGTTLTNQQVTATATTGADGHYSFTNLLPGIYSLSDQPIPGSYTAGAATLGNLGGLVANGELILALPQGGNAMCYDFGLVAPAPSVGPASPPPVQSPPVAPSSGPTSPAPADPGDPAPILSKRSLLGDGWQSLG